MIFWVIASKRKHGSLKILTSQSGEVCAFKKKEDAQDQLAYWKDKDDSGFAIVHYGNDEFPIKSLVMIRSDKL